MFGSLVWVSYDYLSSVLSVYFVCFSFNFAPNLRIIVDFRFILPMHLEITQITHLKYVRFGLIANTPITRTEIGRKLNSRREIQLFGLLRSIFYELYYEWEYERSLRSGSLHIKLINDKQESRSRVKSQIQTQTESEQRERERRLKFIECDEK